MERLRKATIGFYILTLMTFGFWVNFASFSLIIDVAGITMLVCSIVRCKGKIRIISEYRSIYVEVAVFFFGIFIISLISWIRDITLRMCILGARDYWEFILLGFIIILVIPNEEGHDRLLNYITTFSVVMCAFGIFQFVFHSRLPDSLLHVRSGRLDYVYGLGDLIFRINGLFENAIVFNGIIIISSALTFAALLVKGKSLYRLLGFGIAVIANILTFSRAALVGSIMVYSIEYILLGKKGRAEKYIRVLAISAAGIFLFMTFASDTALYQRLFNSSITLTSDIVHTTTIRQAQEAITDNWLLGLGMGTQGYDSVGSTVSVIRDGCWMQFALELGVPLALWGGVLLLTLLATANRRLRFVRCLSQRISCGVYIAVTLYFIVASFINSSYNAKEVFGLCWVLTGLMLWNPSQSEQKSA